MEEPGTPPGLTPGGGTPSGMELYVAPVHIGSPEVSPPPPGGGSPGAQSPSRKRGSSGAVDDGRGTQFSDSPRRTRGGSTDRGASSENVRVLVRVRPFSAKEVDLVKSTPGAHMRSVIDMPRGDQAQVLDPEKGYAPKQAFNFDTVLWSVADDQQQSPTGFADQERVYQETGALILDSAWMGINSCIFAYGQTGSGKTHTMMGDPAQIAEEEGCGDDQLGIIPRLCRQLFNEAAEKQEQVECTGINKSIEVETVFIEIYNEAVHDLLTEPPEHIECFTRGAAFNSPDSPRTAPRSRSVQHTAADMAESPKGYRANTDWASALRGLSPESPVTERQQLKIREHPTEGPQVEGVTVCKPKSYQEVMDTINWGNRQRHVASTKMNDRSSRSHAMFRICLRQLTRLEQQRVGMGGPKFHTSERRANLNLVDLAGSENTKRSGASGTTMIEAQKINLSLTTLRRVIDALIEGKSKATIPYRDSTLTWLLRQDLGGNSKCFMLATVSPHVSNAHESQRTLDYAMRARSITNVVKANEDDTAKMFSDLERRLWENQKKLLTEQATENEKEDLERKVAEIKEEKATLNQRIDSFEIKAGADEEKAAASRKQRVQQRYQHILELAATKEQIQQKGEQVTRQRSGLEDISKQIAATGYVTSPLTFEGASMNVSFATNLVQKVDNLASSFQKARQKVEELTGATSEAEEAYKAAAERRASVRAMQQQEMEELAACLTALKDEEDISRATRGQETVALRDADAQRSAAMREMYDGQISHARDRHVEQLRLAAEDHSAKISQLEQDDGNELSAAIRLLTQQLDAARQDTRRAREESSKRLRALQTAESEKLLQLDTGTKEVERGRREIQYTNKSRHDAKEDVEWKLRREGREIDDKLGELRNLHAEERAEVKRIEGELEALQQASAESVAESTRSRGALFAVSERFRAREAAWKRVSNRSTDYLRFLATLGAGDGVIPTAWTDAQARGAVEQYALYRCRLKSVKPGRAQVQQVNPSDLLLPGNPIRLSWTDERTGAESPRPRVEEDEGGTPRIRLSGGGNRWGTPTRVSPRAGGELVQTNSMVRTNSRPSPRAGGELARANSRQYSRVLSQQRPASRENSRNQPRPASRQASRQASRSTTPGTARVPNGATPRAGTPRRDGSPAVQRIGPALRTRTWSPGPSKAGRYLSAAHRSPSAARTGSPGVSAGRQSTPVTQYTPLPVPAAAPRQLSGRQFAGHSSPAKGTPQRAGGTPRIASSTFATPRLGTPRTGRRHRPAGGALSPPGRRPSEGRNSK